MHKISITPRQKINQDGTPGTKREYVVIDKFRGSKVQVGVATSKKAAEEMVEQRREINVVAHLTHHPNDKHFQRKHGIKPWGETA